jgi:hypothetical protein
MRPSSHRPRDPARWQECIDAVDSPVSMGIALVILAVLCALLLKVVHNNIAPFFIVMGEPVPQTSGIPIIGWAYDLLHLLYVGTGALIAWLLVNLAETMWILIALDRKAHRTAIKESQQEQAAQQSQASSGREDRHIRRMRRRAIKLPFFFQAASGWIALVAFVIDAIVNWQAYPAVKDWGAFMAGLTIGDMSPIDWQHVLQQGWNLFSLELLVVAIIICAQWVWMHRQP